MATVTTTLSPVNSTVVAPGRSSQRRTTGPKIRYIKGFSSFSGLKADNCITTLGLPVSADYAFAKIVCSLSRPSKNGPGGALRATNNAAAEIFQIAAIMNGLTLIGVAVGFVLLRIEAAVEESE